jgi:hypothetical protein
MDPKGTNTIIHNIIEREQESNKAKQLLKKCKAADKGKKEFKADSKTWFYCKDQKTAEKVIERYKKIRDNYLKTGNI